MNDVQAYDGGCLCGAIRYSIEGPFKPGAHCHCAMCRRSSGAPVVTWITVPPGQFTITKGTPALYRSSEHAERQFCPTCGTQLTFWSSKAAGGLDITFCSLDHPEDHPATRHVWTASRLPWLHLDEHLPAHAQFTTPRED